MMVITRRTSQRRFIRVLVDHLAGSIGQSPTSHTPWLVRTLIIFIICDKHDSSLFPILTPTNSTLILYLSQESSRPAKLTINRSTRSNQHIHTRETSYKNPKYVGSNKETVTLLLPFSLV
jgi:hypothetical protein